MFFLQRQHPLIPATTDYSESPAAIGNEIVNYRGDSD